MAHVVKLFVVQSAPQCCRPSLFASLIVLASLSAALGQRQAVGQIFGERSLGQPLLSNMENGATGPGAGRFGLSRSRGNRATDGFVGRDVSDRETFVGLAAGRISPDPAANAGYVEQLRAQSVQRRSRPNANVLQIQRGVRPQAPPNVPRLAVGFDFRPLGDEDDLLAVGSITKVLGRPEFGDVRVTANAGKITLSGVVSSEEAKKLAEAVAGLEAGVVGVENRLRVAD